MIAQYCRDVSDPDAHRYQATLACRVNDDLSLGGSADIYTFAGFLGEGHVEQRQVGVDLFRVPAGAPVS